jgi:hypothetical protein
MARSFKTNSGITTFGVSKEPLFASEYINKKKTIYSLCKKQTCPTVTPQSDLTSLNKFKNLNCDGANINSGNLEYNLITRLDLSGVVVIESNKCPGEYISPAIISNCECDCIVPYLNYIIDPNGSLFGNTMCGRNNYREYLVYNSPYIFI